MYSYGRNYNSFQTTSQDRKKIIFHLISYYYYIYYYYYYAITIKDRKIKQVSKQNVIQ
ncbi:hypothetical protein E2C01_083088 [Portunus trituberculatus]|uniref:Uncharacterized protein n=1 Tax=Portunus trituberculatus TaxID=210409 RepID=A0A5B7IRJ1_PORTR|nr:hypothetical protein [Portunus trituberculatus]